MSTEEKAACDDWTKLAMHCAECGKQFFRKVKSQRHCDEHRHLAGAVIRPQDTLSAETRIVRAERLLRHAWSVCINEKRADLADEILAWLNEKPEPLSSKPGAFQQGLEARLSHVIYHASQWRPGAGAHPPELVKALNEVIEWAMNWPAPETTEPLACSGCGTMENVRCCPDRRMIPAARLIRELWCLAYGAGQPAKANEPYCAPCDDGECAVHPSSSAKTDEGSS